MSNKLDLTGQRFGRLVAISEDKSSGYLKWKCQCDCGNIKFATAFDLRSGHTKSCGCLQRERASESIKRRNFKHGQTRTPLHNSWCAMMQRCYDNNYKWYKDYGARGIKVCPEWHDFISFSEWATSSGFTEGLSIDRIDVNGDYCPENCRWATTIEQANNKRNNIYLEYNGEKKTIAEWARFLNIPYHALYNRIYDLQWPIDKAITEPIRGQCGPFDK